MQDSGIPTAGFQVFSDYEPARAYVYEQDLPVVIKASGLALGKGVYVCNTLQEAEQALEQIMRRSVHGEAGSEVVVEEYLDGPEISVHALSDGKNFILFPPAQDHKRIGDGDTGPNTGGMGTIAPIPFVSAQTMESIGERIVRPVLQALQKSGAPFSGVLYPGLKMTSTGPKVLEFNARFGDPETQVYMRLLKSDILDLLEACAAGDVSSQKPEWNSGFAANIVLASKGYPESYEKGFPIRGIADAEKKEDVVIFHAGTTYDLPAGASAQAGGELKTAGGRVLGVSAIAPTLRVALERAYAAAARIEFEGKYFRRDIGVQALFLG
ncbi:MAG: hypothetical protein UY63_C0018G0015 [Parcubacteria group bacterium GW2011_GWA2_51_10]|nr:MAG: hypothetical protein UY63_C0018G0015 [Parcubacteria group bacterium GW2011_GWA2_51_10]